MVGTLIGTGFVRIDSDTSPALKAIQGLGALGASALSTAILPVTAAVTAGVGAMTATLASAGAAGGAFAAAVVPQFKKITEASEKLQAAEEADEKATIAKAHAQRLAKEMGVKYGQQMKITAGMSAEAKAKAQEYNKALSDVTTATNTARKSQAIYDEKMKAMTPATRETAKAYQGLKDDIDRWSDSLSGTTMPLFTAGINKIREVLPKLTPFVRIGTREVKEFTASFGEGQAGRVFSEFGRNLQGNAGSALGNFLTTVKNITVGVVGMVNAFMPVQSEMSGGMVELTEQFANFGANLGESEGFATFMERARGAVPAMKDIGSALADIISAAGPMSGFGLLVLQVFAQLVSATPTPVLKLIIPAILAVNAGLKLYAVYQSAAAGVTWLFTTSVTTSTGAVHASRAALIAHRVAAMASAVATRASTAATWAGSIATRAATLATGLFSGALRIARVAALATAGAMRALAVAMISSPIGIVIGLLVLLGAAFVVLWKKSETFRSIVRGALNGVLSAAQAVGAWFSGPFADFFVRGWNIAHDKVFAPISRFFTQTLPAAAGVVRDKVTGAWGDLRDRLTSRYTAIHNQVFSPIGDFFTRRIPGWGRTVRDRVTGYFGGLGDRLTGIYGNIRTRVFSPIGDFFTRKIPGWARTLRDRVRGYFAEMRDGIGTIWGGIRSKTKTPVNWVLDRVWNRGIVSVWGKIAGWIGLDNKLKKVKLLAAGGTVGRAEPGVFNKPTAIVGEGDPRYPEYVIPTDPKYATRARGLWQAAGAHFMEKGGILGSIGSAISSAFGKAVSFSKAALDFLSDPVDNAKKILGAPLKRITAAIGTSNWAKMAARIPRMAVDGLISAVKSVGSDLLGFGGGGPVDIGGSGVQRWRGVVRQALGLVKQPLSYDDITLRRMNQESGGNPRAVNLWDINAQRGYPSVGLMQVIRPTFQAHAGRYRNTGPFMYGTSINPLANVYASMRYALSAYGSLPRAYNRPGGYANGTDGATGGWHWVGEMGRELMKLPAGTKVRNHRQSVRQTAGPSSVIHLTVVNHGVIASRQETEDWLAKALDQLSRKGRLPKPLGGAA
jgi:SLT domain-containing protein/phage-related protein